MIYILETIVVTTKHGYVGVVKAWEQTRIQNGGKIPVVEMRKLWSMKTGITRLNKADALVDAIALKRGIESQNAAVYAI